MKNVIAILCSDLHLSEKVPVARSAEKCWFSAMKRSLDELKLLSGKYLAPVIVAGDVFDKWNSSATIINFALENLPKMFAIPGQHDLPEHRYDEIHRSAYWTLVKAGKIINLDTPYGTPINDNGTVWMYPFPWGFEIIPLKEEQDAHVSIAVIHHYLYTKKSNSYYGVSEDNHALKFKGRLKGYDAAVFGDNHISHLSKIGECNVISTGTLMRRKIDEIDYKPTVGLLHDDGTITPHYLDTSKDKFIDIDEAKQKESEEIDTAAFLEELKSLGGDSLDFNDAINRYMDNKKVSSDVRELVLETME